MFRFAVPYRCITVVLITWLLAATAAAAAQGGLPGRYAGDGLQVGIQAAGTTYRGTITQADQVFPFVAHGGQDRIEGTFQAGASSFTFHASLQGEVLTLETGGATYTLRRTAGGGTGDLAAPTAGGTFRAGSELVFAFTSASDTGPNAPGGQPQSSYSIAGYERITVVDFDERRCLVMVATFLRNPMDGRLSFEGSTPRLIENAGESCFYFTDPALLAQTPDAQGPNLLVGRGPYDHNGRQVNALTRVQHNSDEHFTSTYDLETGHLLSFRGQTGDINEPGTTFTKPTTINWLELERVRQLDTLWNIDAPLPPNVAAIEELHYRGVRSDSYIGVSDLPPLETPIDRRFGVQERGASWLLLQTPPNPTPGQQVALNVLAAGVGYFLPPAALARLQPGQLIDEDTILGLRTVVAHVDANTVVLSETMRSFAGQATYDKRTGLLIRLESEGSDGSLITRVRLELAAAR